MHQIDVLISERQAEWAGQWAGLETQLREKERELAAVRHTLWQRDSEVSSFHLPLVRCGREREGEKEGYSLPAVGTD